MIVYSSTKANFERDIINGVISTRLDELFSELDIRKENYAEFRSWENSLPRMAMILADSRIPDESQIAIEYQIPLTAKRVDFMVGGNDGNHDNVVVVELKQWEKCEATSRENVVKAFTGGAERYVAHPSQQAYSYAKLIENLNETVRHENISMIPCTYLHNYKEEYRNQICHKVYNEIIKESPVFLKCDGSNLQEYLIKYIKKKPSKDLFEVIEHGRLKPSKSLQDAVGSILNGNQEFIMIDEQQVAYATILKLVENTLKTSNKYTVIVKGGPGTGKSVIAINLLAKILNEGFSCAYVTKNSAPRYTFSNSLVKGKYKLSYLKGLLKGSGSFIDVNSNVYDCLLVDESHRLNTKSGRYGNLGFNQIKEIIHAAKISVFFIDEDQIVTTNDIGTVDEIKKWAHCENSTVISDESLTLKSQFRCNGSDGYLAFLDDLLGIRPTANYNYFDLDYDIRVFDSPSVMREELRKKNINNKSRMIAGYCYPWNSKKDKKVMDIHLKDGFEAQWNLDTNTFATDPDSFEQVGCIHSTQGLEFDYVGIIIGKDLIYRNGQVITDYTKRDSKDASIKGIKTKKNFKLADRIIKNTYKTLLSRGQKGCFIYCEDEALQEYIKLRLSKIRK